jgi:mevalonate pyrophosphate decarboxylase
MSFATAFKSFRGTASRLFAKRTMSSSPAAGEASSSSSSGSAALAAAVATTFGTYMLADTLSNFLQHPTQKVRRREDAGFDI